MGLRRVPTSSLEEACVDAEIHEVVLSLSGGYEAELLEGAANLSGGQRQRLEIARCTGQRSGRSSCWTRPPARSMRRPSSSSIAICASAVVRAMVVAHRLSTIRDSEEIIVLRRGTGNAARDTLKSCGTAGGEYARLIRSEGEAI